MRFPNLLHITNQVHTLTTIQRVNTFGMGLVASAVGIYARSVFDAPPEIIYPERSKNPVINMGKVSSGAAPVPDFIALLLRCVRSNQPSLKHPSSNRSI